MSQTPNDGNSRVDSQMNSYPQGAAVRPSRTRKRWKLWRQAPMTSVLIIVNVLWYVIIEGYHGLSVAGLVRSGALDFPDVAVGGQWWRLLSAMFVHLGFAHLGVNMISLFSLYVIEWLVGSWYFVLTYLIGGFIGNIATLWLSSQSVISAGASGAIFAIFGVALYLAIRGILTKAARNQLIVMLIINLVYGFSSTDIGNVAHIGGLLTGIAMGAWFVKRPRLRVSRFARFFAYAFVLLTVVSLVLALQGNSPAADAIMG